MDIGTTLRPRYIPYNYMDPLGMVFRGVLKDSWGVLV